MAWRGWIHASPWLRGVGSETSTCSMMELLLFRDYGLKRALPIFFLEINHCFLPTRTVYAWWDRQSAREVAAALKPFHFVSLLRFQGFIGSYLPIGFWKTHIALQTHKRNPLATPFLWKSIVQYINLVRPLTFIGLVNLVLTFLLQRSCFYNDFYFLSKHRTIRFTQVSFSKDIDFIHSDFSPIPPRFF